ncbi:hypothetical protein FF32_15815 [Halomonas campaniensis]|nr:hypothetical protein FF32_15815 [Halomonas campaniensis]
MSPIEPGCLVLVADADTQSLIGLTGIAVKKIEADRPGVYWEVGGSTHYHNQKCLRRIDGGDPDAAQEETHDQEVLTDAIA